MSLFNLLVSKTIMHVPGPIVGIFARGYIAGEELKDAVAVTRDLNSKGMMATIDILGEFIKTREEAIFFKEQCGAPALFLTNPLCRKSIYHTLIHTFPLETKVQYLGFN